VCAHKAAEILPNQSLAVSAASHTQNLGRGERKVREKSSILFGLTFLQKMFIFVDKFD